MKLDMDERFRAAQAAIHDGNLVLLESLLAGDPDLATARSRCSHPTLLQCLVLTISEPPHLEGSIRALAERGAELTDPLTAACGVDNVSAAAALLDLGANIEGNGKWSPLEEALYWGSRKALDLLLSRGAAIDSLRKAAGVGRTDYLNLCFTETGELTRAAGVVRWPWFEKPIPDPIRVDRQQIVDNALVYAAAWCRIDAANALLARGANINARPAGFDFTGTPLHYAALNGRWKMTAFLLEHGADPTARDGKVDNTPDGWAKHGGHQDLAEHLRRARTDPR
jgi:ankyrin repeat protein